MIRAALKIQHGRHPVEMLTSWQLCMHVKLAFFCTWQV